MPSFLTDENFDNRILDGLLRRKPDIDVVRVQDAGLVGQKDPIVLDWAYRKVIEDILLIDECSHEGEWESRICYLPF